MMDNKRPISVTLISWIIIIYGIIYGVIVLCIGFTLPWLHQKLAYKEVFDKLDKLNLHLVLTSIIVVVLMYLVSGIAMLKGFNWGRILYLTGKGILLLKGIIFRHISSSTVWSLIMYIIFFVLLTRPEAQEFFENKSNV